MEINTGGDISFYEDTGTTAKLFWDASAESLGIGTSSPTANLHVNTGTNENLKIKSGSGSVNLSAENDAGSAQAILKLNSGAVTLDASGNLGIGTSSPSQKLHVVGDGNFARSTATDTFIQASNSVATFNITQSANGSAYLYNYGAYNLIFGTSATERMRIDSSGNLLVGTTGNIVNNNARVAIVGTEGLRAQATSAGGTACIGAFSTSSGGTYYYIGYDLTAGAIKYQVLFNGNVQNTNNSYGAISDAKLKENVTDATPKLEKLNQVRVVNFNLIGDEQKQIGVIAQELEQIFPSIVEDTPDFDAEGNELGTTTKSVKYSVFVPMLIKAMQEQQTLIESLTTRIAALEE